MCGEYGDKLQRPHYHYLIFGYNFPDRYRFKTSHSGEQLYRSATLEQLWPFGHSWIGEVTIDSCAYVAAYVLKKMTGEKAWEHYKRTDEAGNDYWLEPEFNLMSRGKGIGKEWWERYHRDVIVQDCVNNHGKKSRPPRYYDKLLELMDPRLYEAIKNARIRRAKEHEEDNTPARLQDKEIIANAKIATKKRNLESYK